MNLSVKEVIGSTPPDTVSLIPLVVQWRVPQNCLVALTGEDCREPLAALYVLDEPCDGHKVLGICAKHDARFRGAEVVT